jgi:hydroxyethylthiazole kinase-like uncharacterized protein yjeF
MTVRVTTAAQAAEIDSRAIASGTSSYDLMAAAGRAAATIIRERFADACARGVTVFAGPGNNGGDGYVVAAELAAAGIASSVRAIGEPKTSDAKRARSETPASIRAVPAQPTARGDSERPGIAVDALLGTGASGAPRDDMIAAIETINATRARGGVVVSLDIPSGVDATTGTIAGASVRADLTVTFGTVKRGLLRNRDACGAIVAVDIGLGTAPVNADGLDLIDAASALRSVPPIVADANKGTRKRLLIVGGAEGMAGATILAARGALRSGIGMVKVSAERPSLPAIQAAEPAALTAVWPADDKALTDLLNWAHVVLLGPGLGLGSASRELAARVLGAWRGPVVVDADALTAFDGNAEALGNLLKGRAAIITPHVVEAQRLAGVAAADLDSGRFEAADRLADRVRGIVLLKGVPTIVSDGKRSVVVAAGTPVLGTGGSGDVLGGIIATLLAQSRDPLMSAAAGAWVHGRAAELAGGGVVRGVTLDDVVLAIREAWRAPAPLRAPILAEFPRAGEGA